MYISFNANIWRHIPAASTLFSVWLRLNTLTPRKNGRHFPDDIFKGIFLNENVCISIKISLQLVPRCPNNHIPALVQTMTWRRSGDKPLSDWTHDGVFHWRKYASPKLNELKVSHKARISVQNRTGLLTLGLALLTLSWDKNWDSHSLVNGYPSFYPRIALVAPSPVGQVGPVEFWIKI